MSQFSGGLAVQGRPESTRAAQSLACTEVLSVSGDALFREDQAVLEKDPVHWWERIAVVKNPPANAGDLRDASSFLGQEDPLEEDTAIHSSILAWRIPWTGEPGGLQSIGLQRVGHS